MNACVIIQISGNRTERLLERMRLSNIPIYALSRVSPATVELTMEARDFKRLHLLARASDCRIHIVKRSGCVFWIRRFYRRYALWGCGLILLVLMFAASTRILWIEIDGCSRIAEQTVLRALASEGVKIGVSHRGLEIPTLTDRIRVYDDRIAWVGLSLDGAILRVKIVEAIPTTDETDPEFPSDVVAQKEGIVLSVDAISGRAVVTEGDTVSPGDLLIRGELTVEESQFPVLVHASGRVLAKVSYVGESVAETEKRQMCDTGNTMPYREVRIAGRTLFSSKISYQDYELRDLTESVVTDSLLPLTVVQGTCFEQAERLVAMTREEMIENALYAAEQFAYLKIPKDAAVIEKHAAYLETEGQILGIVTILTEESIGLTKEIEIDGTYGLQDDF